MSSNCNPKQTCLPIGTVPANPDCIVQTLALDCSTGDLSISGTGGNSVNLACAVNLLQTVGTFTGLTLTGTILQAIIIFEDGVPQAKNVDLASLVNVSNQINVVSSNSLFLSFTNNTLSGLVNIDPASTLPISTSGAGIKFGCCPETPIIANTTNTIQLIPTGSGGHVLTANLKYQSSSSITLSDSSSGLSALVNYSTNANNVITNGTDGALYVPSASSQLGSLPNNGFASTGVSGTLLVGSDSKLYRLSDPAPETQITSVNTNTIITVINGPSNHTVQSNVHYTTTNTIQISDTSAGLQADVKVDSVAPGNVTISNTSNGLVANITETSILGIQNTVATVQNPVTKIYGNLSNGAGGYAVGSLSQYGLKFPAFSTSARLAIPAGDLYDQLFLFDTTIRAFMWYDAVNTVWVQLT